MKTRLAFIASALLTFCAFAMPAHVPDSAVLDWRKRVTEAKALDDPAQNREAMLALVCEALRPREVRLSGARHPDQVHPEDNEPAPIVNFDLRLNQKASAQPRSGAPTRSLQNNFGYYFSFRGAGYVVLGPAALDPRGAVFTRLAAEHELFHAMNHVGDPRPLEDRELETWSQMFVRFFDEMHPFRQRWAPMLSYYEKADFGEQIAAMDRLAAYYEAAGATERAAFEDWLARRKKDTGPSTLVKDLEKAIEGMPDSSENLEIDIPERAGVKPARSVAAVFLFELEECLSRGSVVETKR